MLRRWKHRVLAEVPAPADSSSRPGAKGRAELAAYSHLAQALGSSGAVCTTGPDRSAVAIGLATAAVAEGGRVALLECDLAAPTLARALRLAPTPGLHEYLRGGAEAGQIVQPLVLAGPASGRAAEPLACVAAGAAEASPADLLASAECGHAVEKLRRAYELLVVVGPALGPDPDPLRAVAALVETTVACGGRAEVPRRPPVRLDGVVVVG
jgi:hypothetical protein